MRTKKEILEDELSDYYRKIIDQEDEIFRNWIYDAMHEYAIEFHKYKSEQAKRCTCPRDKKHGSTSVMCCNECGKPNEIFWLPKG